MDDHVYEHIMSYAEYDLIPRFQKEYAENGVMSKCQCYEEMKAFCTALNAIAPWAGYSKVTPSTFLTW